VREWLVQRQPARLIPPDTAILTGVAAALSMTVIQAADQEAIREAPRKTSGPRSTIAPVQAIPCARPNEEPPSSRPSVPRRLRDPPLGPRQATATVSRARKRVEQ